MIKEKMKQLVGKSIKAYNNEYSKPKIDELKFKEQYQGKIIDCMVGEVDDNYIETPETDAPIVKLEHSKEGVVKIPSIKGKTILVDSEGNETNTPGEGCRLISVGESEDNRLLISSKNKNLITQKDIKELEYGWSDYIPIPNDGRYVLSRGTSTVRPYVRQFTHDKVKKNIDETFGNKRVLDVDTGFIRIQHINSISELQLEKGNTSTNYVQHKSHKTEILLNEPLRSLPSGVCDEIVGNKLIRRIGKVVLDGSENWWKNWRSSDDKYSSICRNDFGQKNNTVVSSNILPNISYADAYYSRYEGIGSYNGNGREYSFALCFNKKDSYENASDLLTVNPTTVIYELAEPIIEELPNSITLQGFDDTTMYIENSITPTVSYGYNALIPYKQELLNQQEEVETNTLDIEQNIIPYLMDMEFNLMLMEDE